MDGGLFFRPPQLLTVAGLVLFWRSKKEQKLMEYSSAKAYAISHTAAPQEISHSLLSFEMTALLFLPFLIRLISSLYQSSNCRLSYIISGFNSHIFMHLAAALQQSCRVG
jgi:hypothetical protein